MDIGMDIGMDTGIGSWGGADSTFVAWELEDRERPPSTPAALLLTERDEALASTLVLDRACGRVPVLLIGLSKLVER